MRPKTAFEKWGNIEQTKKKNEANNMKEHSENGGDVLHCTEAHG